MLIVVLDFIFTVMAVKHYFSILALLPCLPVCSPCLFPQLLTHTHSRARAHSLWTDEVPCFFAVVCNPLLSLCVLFCFWFSNSFRFGQWEPLLVAFCVLTFLLNTFVISDLIRCSGLILYPWCPGISFSKEHWSPALCSLLWGCLYLSSYQNLS